MPRDLRLSVAALALVAGTAVMVTPLSAGAQGDSAQASNDTLIVYARKLIEDGSVAQGKKILDSLLTAYGPDDARYAEALYWRAALATAAVDAERDYRRLLIEAPLSTRAEDAMLQLAQLEQARGDRRAATDHMQRFMLTYPHNPARPRVAVSLVRLLFDQGLVARGCDALRLGREAIPQENAELRNQIEFYAPRCVSLETAVVPADSAAEPERDSTTTSPPARREPAAGTATKSRPTRAETAATARSSAAAFYSVQVAAYDSKEAASRMARTLVSRGLQARVDGTVRPFRVRVGKYATRADAVKAAATLKSQGINGFITLVKAGT
jgi:cell division septation protein DedD